MKPVHLRSRRKLPVVLTALALLLVGISGALALGDEAPPPDLDAEDPAIFWANLSPQARADAMAEYPPEDGQTIPALSEAEVQAELESIGAPDPTYPQTGMVDDAPIRWGPFEAVNGWQEVTPVDANHNYVILHVFAGYNREDTAKPGMIYVWADHPWPGSDADIFAGNHDLYPAPAGHGPLRVVSASGHLLSLAASDDPAAKVSLLFDVDSRSFLTPTTGGSGEPCSSCPPGQICPDVCTMTAREGGTPTAWRRKG